MVPLTQSNKSQRKIKSFPAKIGPKLKRKEARASKGLIRLTLHSFTASEYIKLRVTRINIEHLFISYSFILYKKRLFWVRGGGEGKD